MLAHGLVVRDRRALGGLRDRVDRGPARNTLLQRGEGIARDDGPLREQDHALDDVGELPHVAWPRVCGQTRLGVRGEALDGKTVVSADLFEEPLAQERDVGAPRAQRRQGQRQDRETVVEVRPEPSLLDRLGKVGVRRADDPRVGRLVAGASQPPDHALLQHLEELGLERLRQEADLVQEDRAAVSRLEQPRLGLAGVREGAALEAEKLRLDEGLGDGRAVDVDERAACPRPHPVQDAGDETLAAPRLAQEEHGRQAVPPGVASHHAPDTLPDGLDRGALTQEARQFVGGAGPLHRATHPTRWSVYCHVEPPTRRDVLDADRNLRNGTRRRAGSAPATAHEAQHEEEEVDEVQVE